jgi:hypothetical protein
MSDILSSVPNVFNVVNVKLVKNSMQDKIEGDYFSRSRQPRRR